MAGYEEWSQQQLIARIQELEKQIGGDAQRVAELNSSSTSEPTPAPTEPLKPWELRTARKAPPKAFDASKYSTRLIALKFAYLGQKYNGFEHHKNNTTPLPTIESTLR